MGKGDYFGEAGVVQGEPRSATCVAYNHPDNGQSVGGGIVASKVELIRIRAQDLEELCMASPRLREALDKVLRDRRLEHDTRVAVRPYDEKQPIRFHPAFEELGLIQGQKLMLIDLDRCTRCGDCVRACVSAHDDGASRLFLDGPRFGKYLVPDTCRKCRDPVCMIGCPVGSIIRGDDGEIVIKDWCIGCRACADQCPYGAIQMNQLADLDVPHSGPGPLDLEPQVVKQGEVEVKTVSLRAVVCDLCASTPSKDPACVYHCPHDAAFRLDAGYEQIDRFGPAS
jgi:Fe-S-cluster-containing dehydrogenase component